MMLLRVLWLLCVFGASESLISPLSTTLNAVYNMLQSLRLQQPTALSFPAVKDAVDWNSMTILDVRETHDVLNDGKIPNSHNIPVKRISSAFTLSDDYFEIQYAFKKPDKESDSLLVVGKDAISGREGISILRQLGYWNAAWYPGGFQEWMQKGGKIERDLPGAVNFTQVKAGLDSAEALLIDIRLPLARDMFGIIPKSVNVPVTEIPGIFEKSDEEFERTLGFKKPSKNMKGMIVILGTEGTSAEEAAEKLIKLGYKNLKVYPGGFRDWKENKGPVAYPKPKQVLFADVQKALKSDNLVVIDVREAREIREKGRLPGSYNVPLSELPLAFLGSPESFKLQHGFDLPAPPGESIIITGGSSNRRGRSALRRLRSIGYTRIKLYDGSFSDWLANGGNVIKGSPPYTVV